MDNNNSYVFISYAHVNSDAVLPCIEAMKKSNINLWYDEGIEAGSEWPEFIAQKVVNCTKFVLFISNAYLQSQNCKRELNFAISRKKDILSIYIEDVNLSPGMEMQLGTYQAIYRKRFNSSEQFYNSLSGEHYFDICRISNIKEIDSKVVGTQVLSESLTTQKHNINIKEEQQKNRKTNKLKFLLHKERTTYDSVDASLVSLPKKNRIIAIILTFFFGIFGVQKFYLRQRKFGVLFVGLIFVSAYFTPVIYFLMIYSTLEFFFLIFSDKEKLVRKYKCDFTK